MRSGSRREALYVTIITGNRETADGLQVYLERAGFSSHTTRALGDSSMIAPGSVAVVLFPVDFELADVVKRISLLRTARPRLLIVVVTSEPHRLSAVLKSRRRIANVILVGGEHGPGHDAVFAGRQSTPVTFFQ
jgi:hypothetical protein